MILARGYLTVCKLLSIVNQYALQCLTGKADNVLMIVPGHFPPDNVYPRGPQLLKILCKIVQSLEIFQDCNERLYALKIMQN